MRSFALLLLVTVAAGAQPAPRWAQVTYISGATIYLDAGSRQGLREHQRVEVVRGGLTVAELTVDFLSSTRAACSVASSSQAPVVGDSVRYVPADEPAAATVTTPAAAAAARRRRDALRGRLGLRYVMVDPGDGRPTWTQPALDLRLDGSQLGGTPLGVVADIRAYRERRGAVGRGAGASTRVYQGHLTWSQPNRPMHVSVGRQLTPALSTIGIFDGVTIEAVGSHVSGGTVAGAQPDALSFGVSGVVREYGAWIQAHNAPTDKASWSMTLAGIGSYDRGNIDREFAYAQAMLTTRHLSVFATQELDVNRGWKRDLEGGSTTPTSSFAMVRVAPHDAFSVNVGYDNRRNVRLYRDFVDPEIEFDDTFRQGGWAGISLTPGRHVRVNADARQSRGATAADATTMTGSVSFVRLTPLGIGLQGRFSQYEGAVANGRLQSASIEVNPWNVFRLEVGGGTRQDTQGVTDGVRTLSWRDVSADAALWRSLFVMASVYEERGDVGRSRQGYLSLSWRF